MEPEDLDEQESAYEPPEEVYLSVWQCVGLVMLFLVLGHWSIKLFSTDGDPVLHGITWAKIAITGAISGLLTAAAGSFLAGLSFDDLFPRKTVSLAALGSLVLAIFGITVVSAEFGNFLDKIQQMPQDYIDVMSTLAKQSFGQRLLAISVVAPLTEELIFRGVMFEGLRVRYKPTTAMLVSSLMFASVHDYPWPTVIAFLLGLFLVWLKIHTGSLALCMAAHALYNGLPEILGRVFHLTIQGYNTDLTSNAGFPPMAFSVIGILCLAAGIIGIYYCYEPNQGSQSPAPPVDR